MVEKVNLCECDYCQWDEQILNIMRWSELSLKGCSEQRLIDTWQKGDGPWKCNRDLKPVAFRRFLMHSQGPPPYLAYKFSIQIFRCFFFIYVSFISLTNETHSFKCNKNHCSLHYLLLELEPRSKNLQTVNHKKLPRKLISLKISFLRNSEGVEGWI